MLHHPAENLSLTNRNQSELKEGQSSWTSVGWSLPLAMEVRTVKPRALKVGTDPRRAGRYRCHDLRRGDTPSFPSLGVRLSALPGACVPVLSYSREWGGLEAGAEGIVSAGLRVQRG